MKANQLFKTLALGALLLSPLAQAKLESWRTNRMRVLWLRVQPPAPSS